MAAKALSDEQQRFVVQSLAAYLTPAEVTEAVRTEYGVELTRQTIEGYDPTKVAGRRLRKELRTLFEECRQRYLTDTASIGVAQKAFRLNKLHEMVMAALARKNYGQAAQFLEQAAKDEGGAYTNRRQLAGDPEAPIEHRIIRVPPVVGDRDEWAQSVKS